MLTTVLVFVAVIGLIVAVTGMSITLRRRRPGYCPHREWTLWECGQLGVRQFRRCKGCGLTEAKGI